MTKKENAQEEIKRLYRSREEKVVAGVCGGIAEFFNIDPVWPRLIAILLVFFNGVGLIGYIVLWILMPENPKQTEKKKTRIEEKVEYISKKAKEEFNKEIKEKAKKGIKEEEVLEHYRCKRHHDCNNSNSNIIIGAILILIGSLFLAKEFFWDFASKIFWPAIIIGTGIILLFREVKMKNIKLIKPFKLFFGILLLTFGILFLLINFNILSDLSFLDFLHGFWSIGLIIAGVLIIFKQKILGSIILIGTIVFGCLILCTPIHYDSEIINSQKEIEISQGINITSYEISFGAGELQIKSFKDEDRFVYVNSTSTFNNDFIIRENINDKGNKQHIEIFQEIDNGWSAFNAIFQEDAINQMNINLNNKQNIEKLELNFGASNTELDLRNLKVEDLNLEFGASDVTIYFDNNINTKINCGASDLKLLFPKDKNIVIEIDGGIMDVNLAGFNKIDNKYYNHYENKNIDINIKIETGISSISGGYYDE